MLQNRKSISSFQHNILTTLKYEIRHVDPSNEQVILWLNKRIKEIEDSGTWLR